VIPLVPLSSDVDVLADAGVVVLVETVAVPDCVAAAEWVTPAITDAVRAAPATATAPPTMPARRSSRSGDGFSVMTITMPPGASRPSHHSIKRSLRRVRRRQCARLQSHALGPSYGAAMAEHKTMNTIIHAAFRRDLLARHCRNSGARRDESRRLEQQRDQGAAGR
jgi:hypothetical protein